ncbi:MAG: RsmB/NOP family class I SAM-dependent RNA methyltransferase, partial [Paracoccaceae bacterium]|nr:RsmB/NOP family class I SAM-dependent RNA methyltransferase [Paracoccaceae bacterium]
AENGEQVSAFLARHPGWRPLMQRRLTPLDGGDGFYVAHLTR